MEGLNCAIVVWQVPDELRGRITGYIITFLRGTSESTVRKQPHENFHKVNKSYLPEGDEEEEVFVKVSSYFAHIVNREGRT